MYVQVVEEHARHSYSAVTRNLVGSHPPTAAQAMLLYIIIFVFFPITFLVIMSLVFCSGNIYTCIYIYTAVCLLFYIYIYRVSHRIVHCLQQRQ